MSRKCHGCGKRFKVKFSSSRKRFCSQCLSERMMGLRSGQDEDKMAFLEWMKKVPRRCFICGATRRLLIDHDHTTGFIRGILCYRCNGGLPHHWEDKVWKARAIKYLSSTPTGLLKLGSVNNFTSP